MKRTGNLYQQIISIENLMLADNKAKSMRTLAASAEARGEKKKSGGFGGHFRAIQGFKYVGS